MERLMVRGCPPWPTVDALVPVPSHPARLRDRGMDLTGRLGAALARRAGAASRPDLLRRTRLGAAQNDLDRAGRLANVQGVFEASAAVSGGMRILLVDDIVTTGATLDAAARPLEDQGAVVFLVALAFRRELFRRS
jgi:predicted amidophosphoribosyltransferase